MSVEARIYSPLPALSEPELRAAANRAQLTCRLVGEDGQPLKAAPIGPLRGGFVVLAWSSSDTTTTANVDNALAKNDKAAIDVLGQAGRVGWVGLQVRPFDYEEQWADDPEVEEYEEEIGPAKLEAIKACKTRYDLRSGTRPKHCAELVDKFEALLKDSAAGITD